MTDWQDFNRRNLWQNPIWEKFQKSIGRKSWILEAEGAIALVIRHEMKFGMNWLEVPRGPLFENDENLKIILKMIEDLGKKEKAVFVRISSYAPLETKARFANRAFVEARHDHHPQTSLIIDLSKSDEDILSQMKPKGRYNIKVAEKHGVTVRSSDDVDAFYSILSKTGNRDGFGIHPKSYYEKMIGHLKGHVQLLLASYEGKVIAGGIFVYLDEWGIYYYGASDNEYRNVMAPYLVQWEAIKEAKKRGCKHYDFLGIAPENTKKHPWAGVTEFKKKFGGEIVDYPKARDIVMCKWRYALYRLYKAVLGR